MAPWKKLTTPARDPTFGDARCRGASHTSLLRGCRCAGGALPRPLRWCCPLGVGRLHLPRRLLRLAVRREDLITLPEKCGRRGVGDEGRPHRLLPALQLGDG